MASISTDPKGNRTIQFVAGDRKRRSVRLGKVPMKQAEEVCRRVEALNAARITGTALDADTARWLAAIDITLARRLAAAGLTGPRVGARTLAAFVDDYITGRTDLKPATRVSYEQVRRRLVDYFGPTVALRDLTRADGDRWFIHLKGKYAAATVATCVRVARLMFNSAVRGRLISENPFDGIRPGTTKNPARAYYITPEATAKLLDACPNAAWRAIVALCRYGGVRCPSEVLTLTWADVDWARNRFLVRAPKTERHAHGGLRWVPLFPELRPHLESLWDEAEPGAVHVISRYQDRTGPAVRTFFERLVLKAGLLPWPRLMHNMRASRETELAARFPIHVVAQWLGNTPMIAAKHYLQVREEDFAAAVQNPVQQGAAGGRMEVSGVGPDPSKPGEKHGPASPDTSTH